MKQLLMILVILSCVGAHADSACSSLPQLTGVYRNVSGICPGIGWPSNSHYIQVVPRPAKDLPQGASVGAWIWGASGPLPTDRHIGIGPSNAANDLYRCVASDAGLTVVDCGARANADKCFYHAAEYTFTATDLIIRQAACETRFVKQ